MVFLLIACNSANPAQPTAAPLPTAVPPESVPAGEGGGWIAGFQHEFGSNFWEEGMHQYGFHIQCPEPGYEDYGSDWLSFEINDETARIAGSSESHGTARHPRFTEI